MAEINERASVSQPASPAPGPSPQITHLSEEAHEKLTALLAAQIGGTQEEYRLLAEMNVATARRYDDMRTVAEGVKTKLGRLDTKYDELRPYLGQVDELEEGTRRLEEVASKLEAYVTSLEQKLQLLKQIREG